MCNVSFPDSEIGTQSGGLMFKFFAIINIVFFLLDLKTPKLGYPLFSKIFFDHWGL